MLEAVLRAMFWGPACDALPAGVDLLLFNGRMMSGGFPRLFQRCLGLGDGPWGGDTSHMSMRFQREVLIPLLQAQDLAF